jgi:hypothetical protein
MYLKLSVAGHLTIFLTRTRGPFWSIPSSDLRRLTPRRIGDSPPKAVCSAALQQPPLPSLAGFEFAAEHAITVRLRL